MRSLPSASAALCGVTAFRPSRTPCFALPKHCPTNSVARCHRMKASSPRSIRWRQESRSPNGSKVFRDERLNAGASVYHYLEYPHALSVFSEGRLRLANPLTWSDPYENWWNKTLFDRPSPLQQARPYALCWTRSRFDGPAWRMTGFQRTNPIVRIRCRVRDLLAAATALAAE